jgi:nucleoside-diphosphate-sugar epimerase
MTIRTVTITGGAGYVGSLLVPKLLARGYNVRVIDLLLFGKNTLPKHPLLEVIKADIRDQAMLQEVLPGSDALLHLACISNDPSFELDPDLGRSINYDAFAPLVEISRASGIKRFIYASSSSVYGLKREPNVTEDLSLEPLTDYSKYKALCEQVLLEKNYSDFTTLVIRPATVCGFSPRVRLDVCVNLLTTQAYATKQIKIFGGEQLRPNIHIDDMTDLYVNSLEWDSKKIDGQIFNAGYQNLSIQEIAELIRDQIEGSIDMRVIPTNDHRSYHISSEKIRDLLGFSPKKNVQDAVIELLAAFRMGKVPDMIENKRYYNIKTMQEANLAMAGR